MRYKLKSIVVVILFIFWLTSISSFALGKTDEVISNSADWRDVYSSIIYANLIGASNHFLTSTPHGPILLFEIPKNREGIQIITSADKPFYVGYESLMKSKGYNNVEELIFSQSNLELAKRLPQETDSFIVLDDAYGYNALAVAPFAAKAKYYVLFANRGNINEISDFLSTKTVKSIIMYGQLDREVKAALSRYNPETINSESGSRFENNMKIVDKYSEIGNIKQVILTNGEFIESSMMSGDEAVIFIGKNNVPQEIKDYINSRGVDIGVLIGNELIGSATDIRRQLGISVFVKFARGSRVPGGSINPVEDLDRFPMPSYQLSLSIVSISYNKATGLLEVTYKNNVDLATYFKSTITVRNVDGETIVTDGDAGIIFIDGGETKTITYNRTRGIDPTRLNGELTGEIYTIYGESKTSLENVLRGTFKIETIEVMDNTDIEIIDLVYDKNRGMFYVTIENTGKVDAYVSAELIDLWINGEYVTVASDEIFKIAVGQKKDIPVKIALAEEDLLDQKNSEIDVLARFGERMHALINSKTKSFNLKFREGTMWYYGVLIVVIILLLLLLIRRRKRCPRCRIMNKKDATTCKKCGHQL